MKPLKLCRSGRDLHAAHTPFEIWLRRTCFGIPDGAINALPVWHAENRTDLTAALANYLANYLAIRSGMVANVAFGGNTPITVLGE